MYVIMDDKENILYRAHRHYVTNPDKHPYISGFSKIADWYDSYNELLRIVRKSPTTAIRNYWDNVGSYVLDAVKEYDK